MLQLTGDLLSVAEMGVFDIIVHGVNCFNTMGSGIAKQIRVKWPAVNEVDQATAKGDYNKLGNYTSVEVDVNNANNKLLVVNAYTQYHYNRTQEHNDLFEYVSFMMILQKLAFLYPKANYGLPMIGMGLAGGDATMIIEIIEEFALKITQNGGTVTLVRYSDPCN